MLVGADFPLRPVTRQKAVAAYFVVQRAAARMDESWKLVFTVMQARRNGWSNARSLGRHQQPLPI
jgi:hypothetical protein